MRQQCQAQEFFYGIRGFCQLRSRIRAEVFARRASETMLENVAENAIPISVKFSTGRGMTALLKKNPTPEAARIVSISSPRVAAPLLSFFRVTPAGRPTAIPIARERITMDRM